MHYGLRKKVATGKGLYDYLWQCPNSRGEPENALDVHLIHVCMKHQSLPMLLFWLVHEMLT